MASHPRIKDYKLSEEEAEIVRKEQEKLMEDYNKLEAEQQVPKGPKKGGFATQQFDYRTVTKTVETAATENRGARGIGPGNQRPRRGWGAIRRDAAAGRTSIDATDIAAGENFDRGPCQSGRQMDLVPLHRF